MSLNKVTKKKNIKIGVFISLVIIFVFVFVLIKFFNKQDASTIKYTMGAVSTGNISNYLSTTGQVVVSDEYDVKSLAEGTVTNVYKKKGDEVKKGDVILKIDSSSLVKQLRSAQLSLANAQNTYAKAIAPKSALSIAQADASLQNAKDNLEKLKTSQITALNSAEISKNNAENSLENTYDTTLNTIDTAFSGFANIINDTRKILYLTDTILPQDVTGDSATDKNLIDMNTVWNVEIPKYWNDILNSTTFDSEDDKNILEDLLKKATAYYKNAKIIYDKNVIGYRNLSKTSSNDDIKNFLDTSIETAQAVTDSIRSLNNVYNYYIDYNNQRHRTMYSSVITYSNTLKTDTTSSSNLLSSLTSSKTNITSSETNLQNAINSLNTLKKTQPMDLVAAQNSLKIQEESYKEANEGLTDLEKKSYQLSITQAQASVSDIESSISDCTVKAPFDGSIAKMNVNIGDETTSSTSMATIISSHSMAQLTFNEVDVAKIKVGQKSTLTFDAVDGLSLTGTVADVDTMGTVSSGVVSYTVTIAFDTEDSRIKPGMSVTANIILENKSDVVVVPNAAIKTSGETSYVEVFENNSKAVDGAIIESSTSPIKKEITTGLSDDTNTEIKSGLSVGDVIIIKTTKTTTTKTTTGTSLLQTGRTNSSSSKSSSTKSSTSSSGGMGGDMGGGMPPV
ncbi:MAG: efflux RND transporter periplasmic adaptor subunit, partial [Patescibacteria group bacterium]